MFLSRSKSAPVSVELPRNGELSGAVKEALEGVTDRLISLRGKLDLPLTEYLAQPFPMLRSLDVYEPNDPPRKRPVLSLPSVRSLATSSFNFPLFQVPHLVVFSCEVEHHPTISDKLGDRFLEFFRSCPLLQVISLNYVNNRKRDIEFTTEEAYTEAVSLPHLRSFTHGTYGNRIYIGLFNRLSIPPTCKVTFSLAISDPSLVRTKPWAHLFPNPRNPSYLTGVKKVTVTGDAEEMCTAKFQNSENMKISFTIKNLHFNSRVKWLLDFLESSGIMHSLDTLEFGRYPRFTKYDNTPSNILYQLQQFRSLKTLVFWQCDPLPYLKYPLPSKAWFPNVENLTICTADWGKSVLKPLGKIAKSRQKHGVPLNRVTLFLGDLESLLQTCGGEMEELRGCVESVEVTQWYD